MNYIERIGTAFAARTGDLVRFRTTAPGEHYEVVSETPQQVVLKYSGSGHLEVMNRGLLHSGVVIEPVVPITRYANVFPDGSIGTSTPERPKNQPQRDGIGGQQHRIGVICVVIENGVINLSLAD